MMVTVGGCESESVSHSVVSNSAAPRTTAHQAPLSMGSPGKNTGVGAWSLLQGIFPTQGWNPGLPYSRQILCCLSYRQVHMCFPHGLYIGSALTFKKYFEIVCLMKMPGKCWSTYGFLAYKWFCSFQILVPPLTVCLRTGKHETVHHLHSTGCGSLWPDSPAGRLDTKLFKDVLSGNGMELE